jgi:hypothetical protein
MIDRDELLEKLNSGRTELLASLEGQRIGVTSRIVDEDRTP